MYQPSKELTVLAPKHPCLSDWRQRVDGAEKRGFFTQEEIAMAWNWNLCAVGEARAKGHQFAVDMRFLAGEWLPEPVDDMLADLGSDFPGAVEDHCFEECRFLLSKIEDRLAELVE